MRSFFSRTAGWCALSVLMGISSGCGDGAPTVPTEHVRGVVTLDGTPVEGATVTFTPVDAAAGGAANGYTDPNGEYELTLLAPGPGMKAELGGGTLPGEYRVSVIKSVAGEVAEPARGQSQAPKLTYVVPKKYANVRTSGLTATVQVGGNDVPLQLSTK